MSTHFSRQQLCDIREQALIYQCACPAQLSETAAALLELHAYQEQCLDQSDTDRRVHQRIAEASLAAHAIIEQCLSDILQLEGWDMERLRMPEHLQKRLLAELLENTDEAATVPENIQKPETRS